MATRQYIGARYVPKFADPIEWVKENSYEALTIVTHLNNSYTSKKAVPANTEITNSEYWVVTGNYNAQVEQYRLETESYKEKVDAYKADTDTKITDLTNDVDSKITNLTNKVDTKIGVINNNLNGKIITVKGTFGKTLDNGCVQQTIDVDTLGIRADNTIVLGSCAHNKISNTWWSNDAAAGIYNGLHSETYELSITNLASGGYFEKIITNLGGTNIVGFDLNWNKTTVLSASICQKENNTYVQIRNNYTSAITDTGTITIYYLRPEDIKQLNVPCIDSKLRVNLETNKTYLQVTSVLPSQYGVGDEFRVSMYIFNDITEL